MRNLSMRQQHSNDFLRSGWMNSRGYGNRQQVQQPQPARPQRPTGSFNKPPQQNKDVMNTIQPVGPEQFSRPNGGLQASNFFNGVTFR